VPSTAHFLKDKKISIVFRHWIPFSLADSGKTHPLSCNQLCRRFGFTLLVDRYAQPHEYSPLLVEPFDQKNQKPVLNHSSRRLVTAHRHLDSRVFPGGGIERRTEKPFSAPKLAVGTPAGKELHRLLCEILNAPTKQPTIASDFPIPTNLLGRDLGAILNYGRHFE
jgi:hypothetical protein